MNADERKFRGERVRVAVVDEICDFMDDVQDHHTWSDGPLPVCTVCGALSSAWEE